MTLTPWARVVPKAAPADEQIVQQNIHHAGNGHEVHRCFGIAQPAENRADDIIRHHKGNPDETNQQVIYRSRRSLFRGGHQRNDGPHAHRQQHQRNHGDTGKENNRIADDAVDFITVAAADGMTDFYGSAHGKAHNHDREHVHHLTTDGNSGGCLHGAESADDEQIRHAV